MHITSVTTKTYAIDKQSYFKLLVTMRYKKNWWINLISLAVVFVCLWNLMKVDETTLFIALPLVIILSTGIALLRLWRFVNSKGTQLFYLKRHYVMDYDKLSSFVEDGSNNVNMINSFIKTERTGAYYLLYQTKAHCIFIPEDVFKTPEDRQWFETNVIGKIKTPGFM